MTQTAMRDRIKEFRRVPASELRANPRNWRTHPPEQQAALKGVLEEIGFADAVIARETPDGLELIDGHLRADTLPNELIPTLVLDVNEAEAHKLLLTIDPLAAMAGSDDVALSSLLEDVDTDNEALKGLLDGLNDSIQLHDPGEIEDVAAQEAKAEELRKKWGTEKGQLWFVAGQQLHLLMCGDSTDEHTVSRLLSKETPFIMVTDPPYGVDYDPNWRIEAAKNGLLSYSPRRAGVVENDDRLDWTDAYQLFPGTVAYVWHAGRFAGEFAANLHAAGFEVRSQIIWNKSKFAISRGHYHWQHEPCWYAVRKGSSSKWCGDHSQSTIWDITNTLTDDEGKTDHGTQKPIECMARPIRNHGDGGDAVYDPFLGSGTTMLAAERLGRKCYGVELNPTYCAVILQRMTDAGCECRLDDTTQG